MVSLVDVLPTLVEIAGADVPLGHDREGHSLVGYLSGSPVAARPVFAEYLGEGAVEPIVMVRQGRFKLISSLSDPPLLFDLKADPLEHHNLATDPEYEAIVGELAALVAQRWDLEELNDRVLASQRERRIVHDSLSVGEYHPWDYAVRPGDEDRFVRNRPRA